MKKNFNIPLINAHAHSAMVAFRGLAEDLPLKVWLEKYIWPAEKKMVSPKFVYQNTKKAIREMRKNGIEAFSDMYFFEDEVARAAKELKMNVVIGECLMDFPTPNAKSFEEGLKITEQLLLKYRNDAYVKVAVAPHSIYALSGENIIRASKLAKKHKAIFHIHLAETKNEFGECKKKNKCTPVAYLEKLGVLDEKSVLAHCVWVTDEDIKLIAKRKAKVAHCPLSNLKLGSGIAPIAKMLDNGVIVALGTDGAASSNRLDIWKAGKFAALLQKGITCDPAQVSAKTAIEMMSVNGMAALGFSKIKGESLSAIRKKISSMQDCGFLYN